jgi:regulator of sigma E protease
MNSLLISLVAVAIVLGVVVLVHEWGHFMAAKLFGVRVVVFSIGYGTRLFGWKSGDTDYRVSVLPLGGYVRLAGDNPVEERTGASYEFLSRPRWQRVLIYCAGPFMNLVLAFVVATGIYLFLGMPVPTYMSEPAKVAYVAPHSSADVAGLKAGDRISKINAIDNPTWEQVYTYLAKLQPGTSVPLQIERGGQQIPITTKVTDAIGADQVVGDPYMEAVISEVASGMPADRAGLRANDKIVAAEGQPIATWTQLVEIIKGSNGNLIHLTAEREGKDLPFEMKPILGPNELGQTVYVIGAARTDPSTYRRLGAVESFKEGGVATANMVTMVLGVVKELITGKVSVRQLQSVVGIARESGQAAKRGAVDFVSWLAVISVNLGILNLLPIPILDGGHILLLTIEGAMRRDISLAIKERIVQVGVVFLLVIFAIVMYNDVARVLPHH